MRVGIVGLGRMGQGISKRWLKARHEVVGFDIDAKNQAKARKLGVRVVSSLSEMCRLLPSPRVVWLMVPAGKPVDNTLRKLLPELDKGDVVVDGGNSHFDDSVRRGKTLGLKGVEYLDCGTSGGLEGETLGYSLMVGGKGSAFRRVKPLMSALAYNPPHGLLHVGPLGSGHYVKMVHNGIEYAMLEAYGEGFEILTKAPWKLNFARIAHVWGSGGIVRSWLLQLLERQFHLNPRLSHIRPVVGGGQTGKWCIDQARKQRQKVPSIKLALDLRLKSRKGKGTFAQKVVAVLRRAFGGHEVKK